MCVYLTDRQTETQTDRQTNRQTQRVKEGGGWRERRRKGERDTQRER